MNANMLHNWDKWAEVSRRTESHLFDFIFILGVCTVAYLRGHEYMVLHMHLYICTTGIVFNNIWVGGDT